MSVDAPEPDLAQDRSPPPSGTGKSRARRTGTADWTLLAIGLGALIAAALAWALLLPSDPKSERLEPSQYGSLPYVPDPSCAPERLAETDPAEGSRKRYRCRLAIEEQRPSEAELVQQVRSANAAEATVDLTYRQSIMLAAGTAVGFLTLVAAFLAALYARNAAAEAKRSSDSAESSLAHARAVADAELRAWVSVAIEVRRIEKLEDSYSFEYDLVLTNLGKSVAKAISFRSELVFFGSEEAKGRDFGWWPDWSAPPKPGPSSLMPGESLVIRRWEPRPADKMGWQLIHPDNIPRASPIVYASAFYRTATSDEWHRTDRAFTIGDKEEGLLLSFIRENVECWDPEQLQVRRFSGTFAT